MELVQGELYAEKCSIFNIDALTFFAAPLSCRDNLGLTVNITNASILYIKL